MKGDRKAESGSNSIMPFSFAELSHPGPHRFLIEASAGTGKTYTLERIALYYMLSPEHGYSLRQILIVTFTNKAARELRTRIRILLKRILDDAGFARQILTEMGIERILAKVTGEESWRGQIIRDLRRFAQAPIFTMHGFCQNVIKRYPIESGSMLDHSIDQDLVREAATDYFRKIMSEGALQAGPMDPPDYRPVTGKSLVEMIKIAQAVWGASDSYELVEIIARTIMEGIFDPGKFRYPIPGVAGFAEIWNTGKFGKIGETAAADEQSPDALRVATAFEFARRFAMGVEIYRRDHPRYQNLMNYDDMIAKVALAVHENDDLIARLSQDYRTLLIDEFQDTDGVQWDLFDTIASRGANLIVVGDPKQSIYAFRGADLNAYLRARGNIERIFELNRNYRSNPFLISACNDMFEGLFHKGSELGNITQEFRAAVPGRDVNHTWALLAPNGEPLPPLSFIPIPEELASGIDSMRTSLCTEICDRIKALSESGARIRESGTGEDLAIERPIGWNDITVLVQRHQEARLILENLVSKGIAATISGKGSLIQSDEARELGVFLRALENPWDSSAVHAALLTRIWGMDTEDLEGYLADGSISLFTERFIEWHRDFRHKGLFRIFFEALRDSIVPQAGRQGPRFPRTYSNYMQMLELFQQSIAATRVPVGRIAEAFFVFCHSRSGQEESPLRKDSDSPAVKIMTIHSSKGLEFPIVFLFAGIKEVNRKPATAYFLVDAVVEENGIGERYRSYDPFRSEQGWNSHQRREWDEWLRLWYVAATRAQAALFIPYPRIPGSGIKVKDTFLNNLFKSGIIEPDGLSARHHRLVETGMKAILTPALSHMRAPKTVPSKIEERKLRLQTSIPAEIPSGWVSPIHPPTEKLTSFTALSRHSGNAPEAAAFDQVPLTALHIAGDADEPITEIGTETGSSSTPAGAAFGTIFHAAMEVVRFTEFGDGNESTYRTEIKRIYETSIEPKAAGMRFGRDFPSLSSIRPYLDQLIVCTARARVPVYTGQSDLSEKQTFRLWEIDAASMYRELEFHAQIPVSGEWQLRFGEDEPLNIKLSPGFLTGSMDLVGKHHGRWHIFDWKTNILTQDEAEHPLSVMHAHSYNLQALIYQSVLHQILCADNGIEWNPACAPDNPRAKELYLSTMGRVYYLFVRALDDNRPGRGVYDATPDWEEVLDFQVKAGLYAHVRP